MSLRPRSGEQVPSLTAQIARTSNPAGTTTIWVRDRLDGLWRDEDFVGDRLVCFAGRDDDDICQGQFTVRCTYLVHEPGRATDTDNLTAELGQEQGGREQSECDVRGLVS